MGVRRIVTIAEQEQCHGGGGDWGENGTEISAGWASVAHQLAQAMGVARDGTVWIAGIDAENSNHGLARPLQKVGELWSARDRWSWPGNDSILLS
jgi:hypothetical protein